MAVNVYISSDHHFFHENIIHYCNRPFKNCEEMHKKIITEHNRFVRPDDVVYFLGDLGFSSYEEVKSVISQLNGKKILIMGNHDKWGVSTYYNLGFDAVLQEATIKLGKRLVTLEHYPRRSFSEFIRLMIVYWQNKTGRGKSFKHKWQRLLREWKKHKYPTKGWHINGHVHEAWKVKGRNINVSVDQWNFAPVSVRRLISIMDKEDNRDNKK